MIYVSAVATYNAPSDMVSVAFFMNESHQLIHGVMDPNEGIAYSLKKTGISRDVCSPSPSISQTHT